MKTSILAFFAFIFSSCANNISGNKYELMESPFIVHYEVDKEGYLNINLENKTNDKIAISSLSFLCNVNIKAKKDGNYLNTIKVKVNCNNEITKLIYFNSGDHNSFKFSYNLNKYFSNYNEEKIEIYYIGKIFKNGKEVKLINNRLL
ncbi:hypothetical protein GCM10022217_21210 [Chryseobacterium ginsenosidimutans]|uniref:hypothetical protein n=1 Tax=Chryseobacterium ginsenosidimutans TaxID=687846 RepID=UPI0031D2C83A